MRFEQARWSAVAIAAVLAAGAMPVWAQLPTRTDTTRTDTTRTIRDSARVTRSVGGEVVPSLRVTKDAPAPAATPAPAAVDTTARMPAPEPAPAAPAAPAAPVTQAAPTDAAVAPIVASLQTDAHAVALLHEANLAEVEAGRRAQTAARDSAVRAFAARMVEEHGALDQQASALAQRLSVTPALPDSALPQLHASELRALPSGTMRPDSAMTPMRPDSAARPDSTMGAMRTDTTMQHHAGMMHGAAGDFDRAYVAQQVTAHARTLALVDAAIQRAQQAELRTMLETEVRPKVAEHLRMAQELQSRLGAR